MNKTGYILFFCFTPLLLFSQVRQGKIVKSPRVEPVICRASGETEKLYLPPPDEFLQKSAGKKSDIVVTYSLFPEDAMAAFEYAVSIWESLIESKVPIYVQANWRKQDSGILGSASPAEYFAGFENAPHRDRFYPVAIAEKLAGNDINPIGYPDIECTFNSSINWYFGTDGKTPGQLYDFVTVVLHELGHGLGFTGFFYATTSSAGYMYEKIGDASAFDFLIVNEKHQFLTNQSIFTVPSAGLYNAVTSNALYSKSPAAAFDNYGNLPRLYAPFEYDDGSSIYHLNDNTYSPQSGNSLMTHAIGKGEAVHNPGELTMGILADIGWKNMFLNLEKPKDTETKKPIAFNLRIESDLGLDTASLFLYYSFNNLKDQTDSVRFAYTPGNGYFSATLNPAFKQGEIQYYVKARDLKKRYFSLPSEAPSENYLVKIGPDTEPPLILHDSIPYFILTDQLPEILAVADDNLGIDTVFVEYSINGIAQPPFGLKNVTGTNYAASFSFALDQLNDGDQISYRIVARDSSASGNMATLPANDFYSFRIEKIFAPVISYVNDFDNPGTDFIIFDFDIYTADGFDNGALQSPHPYPSPNKNNTEWNFWTLLKYPIILQENASMSFDEIVLVEPGETLSQFGDDDFWDYVIVEGSKDTGKTWLPLIAGYDSGANPIWKDNYNKNIDGQVSTTVPEPGWYAERMINLLENGNFKAGDTILIRFRLFSDPYAHGWGWTIDNLRIQQKVDAGQPIFPIMGVQVYPNPVRDILNVFVTGGIKTGNLTFEVVNLPGQKMITLQSTPEFSERTHQIDFSGLPPGIYFLNVYENKRAVINRKIVKQ